ncbi:acyltransferase family protein [Streptacidiphilus jiangxiensis]|uniref:Fucose 4-O-acetylase n=1 Tax=Streptacidiphilus jiangxiensis TaxID=235985 RepID=A0A1H7KQY4_STRJI|nr:acyltransferase [Streptacidiphilus jiangxiensis]SEK88964.1 Fucose 4-O-acetylase [Streptacidiphilus jiangxiensis]
MSPAPDQKPAPVRVRVRDRSREPERDRYLDLLRALAISCVVVGHWLITALTHRDGALAAPELLATVPWTQWLTLVFQIMPLFFLAGGCAAAGSWSRAQGRAWPWIRQRTVRLLLPTGVYAGLALLAVAVCAAVGVDPGLLAMVGWALAMQFWFLPVYLLITALTPALHAAHRRFGLAVPAVLALTAVAVDVTVLRADAPVLGSLNYVLVWAVAYQLGFCWADGLLTRHPALPWALALGGGLGFALLVAWGPFPVSLILVSTETVSNTDPPSVAMLAWVVAQCGLCVAIAPAARRLLRREWLWRVVRPVGRASMSVYLWHMVPVLAAAGLFYLTRLAPEPAIGSGAWWVLRLPWLAVLTVLLLALLAALTPLERALRALASRLRPEATVRFRPAFVLGFAAVVCALAVFARHGFAFDGRFPLLAAASFVTGLLLTCWPGPAPALEPPPEAEVVGA